MTNAHATLKYSKGEIHCIVCGKYTSENKTKAALIDVTEQHSIYKVLFHSSIDIHGSVRLCVR